MGEGPGLAPALDTLAGGAATPGQTPRPWEQEPARGRGELHCAAGEARASVEKTPLLDAVTAFMEMQLVRSCRVIFTKAVL